MKLGGFPRRLYPLLSSVTATSARLAESRPAPRLRTPASLGSGIESTESERDGQGRDALAAAGGFLFAILHAGQTETLQRRDTLTRSVSEEMACEPRLRFGLV